MNLFKAILVIATFFLNAGFSAAATSSFDDDNRRAVNFSLAKLTPSELKITLEATKLTRSELQTVLEVTTAFMPELNKTCRYPIGEEKMFRLPALFKVVFDESRERKNVTIFNGPASQALDSLLTPLGNGEGRIVDCTLAINLAILQACRVLIGNDPAYDRIIRKRGREIARERGLEIGEEVDELVAAITGQVTKPILGGLCYIPQLQDYSAFTSSSSSKSHQKMRATLTGKGITPYNKHINGHYPGHNLMVVAFETFVCFAPGFNKSTMTSADVTSTLIEDFNGLMKATEKQAHVTTGTGPKAIEFLESLQYNDPKAAADEMRRQSTYFYIIYGDFKKDFVSDFICELGKAEQLPVLQAIKGFSIDKSFQIFKSITAADAEKAGISLAKYTLEVIEQMKLAEVEAQPYLVATIRAAAAG